MTKRCMTCHSVYPMDDPKPGVSDGFCPRTDPNRLSLCAQIYLAWSRLKGDAKPDLHTFYRFHWNREEEAHA